jgi:hypothetical protein
MAHQRVPVLGAIPRTGNKSLDDFLRSLKSIVTTREGQRDDEDKYLTEEQIREVILDVLRDEGLI